MATGGQEQGGYSLVRDRPVTLEKANETPDYISIAICQNKIIVIDFVDVRNHNKVKIYRLRDGKFLDMLDSQSPPIAICLMDAKTICVLHVDGLIEMASIESLDISPVFTITNRFRLHVGFYIYCSVARVNGNIVVVGEKHKTRYWCIASFDDGNVDTIHRICRVSKELISCYMTTKDNMIYISCDAGISYPNNTGVYGFDILNPNVKYEYHHDRLQLPRSVVINEDGNIFVCNHGSSIHQLTPSCQLVTIFCEQIMWYHQAMYWYNRQLYVTCLKSPDITVFRNEYQGNLKKSEVLVSDERKWPGIDESALQIAQGNVDNGQSRVETEMPPSGPSPEDSADEKQGNHTDSEVQISDDGNQQVTEGTSTQIGQEIGTIQP